MKRRILKARKWVLVSLTHRVALPVLKKVRKPNVFTYTKNELEALPADTLGNDLFHFLEQRKLPLLKHYSRHDLKHVVLGYDTTEEGEACLQSFMLGNGRISFPVLATVGYAFFTMPGYWHKMKKAFNKGKRCKPIHAWKWNEIIEMPTMELRRKMLCKDH